jgi:Flp pilus assembly protein TadD
VLGSLGLSLFEQGKLDEAARHFSEALRIEPGNGFAEENLRRLRQAARRRP